MFQNPIILSLEVLHIILLPNGEVVTKGSSQSIVRVFVRSSRNVIGASKFFFQDELLLSGGAGGITLGMYPLSRSTSSFTFQLLQTPLTLLLVYKRSGTPHSHI